jgi:putative MATE family efflux protein
MLRYDILIRQFIGDKQFYKRLFVITLPLIVQQLITVSVQLIDNIMVGRLGELAIGSVAVVNQLFFVIILITFGVMSGAGIYSAQYFGSKDYDKLRQTFRFKILAGIFVSIVAMILLTVLGRFFIGLFTENTTTISMGMDYLSIVRFSILPWVLTVAISNTFRETGVTKPLLYISIVAILTNTLLNFVLIFGLFGFPRLEVVGAAIGTLIARIVEFSLTLLLLMKKGKAFNTSLKALFKINPVVLKGIFIMAIPLTLNEALWSLGQTTYLQAYSTRGDSALAAMNITNAISQLVFVMFGAIATGIAVLVGNTLGRNALHEAKDNAKKVIAFAVMFACFMGIILFSLSFFIVDLYDVEILTRQTAIFNIRVNSLFIPIYAFNVSLYFTLRSGGDMRSTMMIDSGFMWIISVPFALILAHFTNLPVTLMFLLVQSTEIPKVMFALHRYRKGYWIKNLAISDDLLSET